MEPQTHLLRRTHQIMAELAGLGPMRKGTLSEQYVATIRRDGSAGQRGPYTVYTCKEAGRTVSRRLSQPAQIALYRQQIAAFRRFQELTAELARLGQQRADLEAAGRPEGKKNSRR
jgi:hypothetical protein